MSSFRCDRGGKVTSFARTPQGGIKAPAYLTRTGVFVYLQDGKPFRELRHPDEVFDAASLASLAAAPITIHHPGKVTPETWQRNSVGHVADDVKRSDIFVAAELRVQDAKAVQGLEDGTLVELSCGYDRNLDMTPGVYDGQAYDAIQREIRYNHVALLPPGGGRAGSEVRVRHDAADMGIPAAEYPAPMAVESKTPNMDAVDELAKAGARADVAEGRADTEKARADAATGDLVLQVARADAAEVSLKAANARADAAEASLARFDANVAERVALVDGARRVLGAEFKVDGVADRDLQIATIVGVNANFKADGRSDDYVRGVFETTVASVTDADVSRAKLKAVADSIAAGAGANVVTEGPIEKAQREAAEHWRKVHNPA